MVTVDVLKRCWPNKMLISSITHYLLQTHESKSWSSPTWRLFQYKTSCEWAWPERIDKWSSIYKPWSILSRIPGDFKLKHRTRFTVNSILATGTFEHFRPLCITCGKVWHSWKRGYSTQNKCFGTCRVAAYWTTQVWNQGPISIELCFSWPLWRNHVMEYT